MNVLIVDDDLLIREYLSGAVAKAFEGATVYTANNLAVALDVASDCAFDLVLLDVGLPGWGGIESLMRFREAHPGLRVAIVSANDDQVSIRGALAAGAAGFIQKTSNPKVVVGALRLIAEGGRYFPPEPLAGGDPRQPESRLTGSQHEVFVRLVRGRTIAEIAKELDIAESTAKQDAIAVYAAFDVSSRADLVVALERWSA